MAYMYAFMLSVSVSDKYKTITVYKILINVFKYNSKKYNFTNS